MKEIYCYIGLQHCRRMTIGAKIAELANDGDARAAQICAENPNFFSFVCDI